MRLLSFENNGRASFGIVTGNGVVDAGRRGLVPRSAPCARHCYPANRSPRYASSKQTQPDHALEEITFPPVIPDAAAKLICVGINYLPHIKEMGRERPPSP